MENLFEDAEGWELLQSHPGSPGTVTHVLRRYANSQGIQENSVYAFKTVCLVPAVSTKTIQQHRTGLKHKDYWQVKAEVEALRRLKPYGAIVEIFQVIWEEQGHLAAFFSQFLKVRDRKGKCVSLILQYCPRGSLRNYLSADRDLSPTQIITICSQITECLVCLREAGILHRDLRTANLLLTDSGLKLTDFDAAFILEYSGSEALSVAVNRQTSAPQLISLMGMGLEEKRQVAPQNLFYLLRKCDVYSFGTILYELITREEFRKTKINLLETVPARLSRLAALTKAMLEEDPEERVDLAQVCDQIERLVAENSVQIKKRESSRGTQVRIPQISFDQSNLSRSQSNSLSKSDWSLEEPVPELYRKAVKHPAILSPESSSISIFRKLPAHQTMIS